MTEMGKPKEGWGAIRPGDRKSHYYVGGESLCHRIMFYTGPHDDPSLDEVPSDDDHKECRKLLTRRLKAKNEKAADA